VDAAGRSGLLEHDLLLSGDGVPAQVKHLQVFQSSQQGYVSDFLAAKIILDRVLLEKKSTR
jgi:hypothetical protein